MPADVAQDHVNMESHTDLRTLIRRDPLTAYFVIAFLGTWLIFLPLLLSDRGLGIIHMPDGLAFVIFVLSTYAGPFFAAWLVNRVVDGPPGVRLWFRRMLQWRVGWGWYVGVFIGYPLAFGLPALIMEGQSAARALQHNAGTFVLGYLAAILIGFFAPTLGEEAGWRGFALDRLQRLRGPLQGTLLLAALHALWHLPAYFLKGAISESGVFDPALFIANSLAIVASSIVWTWLFNRAGGSILFATYVHAVSNAMSGNLAAALNLTRPNVWFAFGVSAVLALLVILLTRARLGYTASSEA